MWSSNWSLPADWPEHGTPATEYSELMDGFIIDEDARMYMLEFKINYWEKAEKRGKINPDRAFLYSNKMMRIKIRLLEKRLLD